MEMVYKNRPKMNQVHLFIDDFSYKRNITEFDDINIKTVDQMGWCCDLDADTWPKNTSGYCLSFAEVPGGNSGFSLELNQEGAEVLYRILRDLLHK